MGWQTLFYKDQINIIDFVGHTDTTATTQLSANCSAEAVKTIWKQMGMVVCNTDPVKKQADGELDLTYGLYCDD